MGENPEPPILRTNKSNSFSLSLYIMAPRSHGLYCLSKVSRYCWPAPSAYCLNLWVQCAWAVHSSVFFYYRQYFSPLDSISHYRDAWGNTYFVKTKAKKVLPCVFRFFLPIHFSSCTHICFILLLTNLQKPFLPYTFLNSFKFSWALSFLCMPGQCCYTPPS